MKIASILSQHTSSGQAKTASRVSSVDAAINEALSETTKTASHSSPMGDLEKMASDVALANRQDEIGHVRKLANVFADSVVERLALHEQAASQVLEEKVAHMGITADEIAAVRALRENPGMLNKVASEDMMMKEASDIWDETVAETVRGIHKSASWHWKVGYATMLDLLRQ
jgi:hypothetical protein